MAQSRKKGRKQNQSPAGKAIKIKTTWLFGGLVGVFVLFGVGLAGWAFAQQRAAKAAYESAALQNQAMTNQAASDSQAGPQQHTVAMATDAEGFISPPSDPDSLVLAEAGELGQPALVWFHADWCHVCQQIKPAVAQMEQDWHGKVRLVRLNVDDPQVRNAASKYRVRGTPTFAFITKSGEVLDSMSGWPGQSRVEQMLDRMIAMN